MNKPQISGKAYVLEGARLVGDVTVADGASVFYNAVLRGDSGPITLGANTNVQDNTVIHSEGGLPMTVGSDVTIGHSCIIHGCSIGDNTLVGMGSILMDEVKVGKNCIIGAGSLVTGGTEIPDGMMAFGRPAKVVRPCKPEEIEHNAWSAKHYVKLARENAED